MVGLLKAGERFVDFAQAHVRARAEERAVMERAGRVGAGGEAGAQSPAISGGPAFPQSSARGSRPCGDDSGPMIFIDGFGDSAVGLVDRAEHTMSAWIRRIQVEDLGRVFNGPEQKCARLCSNTEFSECGVARIVSGPLIPKLALGRGEGATQNVETGGTAAGARKAGGDPSTIIF